MRPYYAANRMARRSFLRAGSPRTPTAAILMVPASSAPPLSGDDVVAAPRRRFVSSSSFPPPRRRLRRARNLSAGHELVDMTPQKILTPPSPYNTELEAAFGNLDEPYDYGTKTLDEYLKLASLSPWVPTPDVVARKMMDVAEAGPNDVHVDLGSGDGRLCFQAIDYGCARSIGIDVDPGIVEVAQQRLRRRHPPPALEFFVADLLKVDSTVDAVWDKVREATIITMYFAEEALRVFRPVLEEKLAGCECKILTCGYEMPGWNSRRQEVVLGTQIHRYDWGSEEEDGDFQFAGPDILEQKPEFLDYTPLENNSKFSGYTIVDKTPRFPFGYDPDNKFDHPDDYDGDDSWFSDAEEEEEEEEEPVVVKKTKGCSKTKK